MISATGWLARSMAKGVALLALASNAPGVLAQMIVPDSFSVTPTGAASYMVPIKTPPGIGSIRPQIALAYSSQAGTGISGVGW